MMQEAKRLGITVTDAESTTPSSTWRATSSSAPTSSRGAQRQRRRHRYAARPAARRHRLAAGDAARSIQPRVQISDLELDQQAARQARRSQQLRLHPQGSHLLTGGQRASRTAEANQYRKSFTGCDSAVQLSLSYTDAAVHRHRPPPRDAVARSRSPRSSPGSMSAASPSRASSRAASRCWRSARRRRPEDLTFIKDKIRAERATRHSSRKPTTTSPDLRQGQDRLPLIAPRVARPAPHRLNGLRRSRDGRAPDLPPLAVSMGEPAGIGPDLILQALRRARELESAALRRLRQHGVSSRPRAAGSASTIDIARSRAERGRRASSRRPARRRHRGPRPDQPGRDQPARRRKVVHRVHRARGRRRCCAAACRGLVTAPIHKAALYSAGFKYPGHTEFLAALCANGGRAAAGDDAGARGPPRRAADHPRAAARRARR